MKFQKLLIGAFLTILLINILTKRFNHLFTYTNTIRYLDNVKFIEEFSWNKKRIRSYYTKDELKVGPEMEFYTSGASKRSINWDNGILYGNQYEYFDILDTVVAVNRKGDTISIKESKIKSYQFLLNNDIITEFQFNWLGHLITFDGKTIIDSYFEADTVAQGNLIKLNVMLARPIYFDSNIQISLNDTILYDLFYKNRFLHELEEFEVEPHLIGINKLKVKHQLTGDTIIVDSLSLNLFVLPSASPSIKL